VAGIVGDTALRTKRGEGCSVIVDGRCSWWRREGGCIKRGEVAFFLWFMISAPSSTSSLIPLTAETLVAIKKAGRSMELAGATANNLLAPPDNNDEGSNSITSTSSNDSVLSTMAA